MTKRVVIVTSYPFPGVAATANRVRALAEALSRDSSFYVTVVGPGSDQASSDQVSKNRSYRVVSRSETSYPRRNLPRRAYRELAQAVRLFRAAKKVSPDIVIVTIPSVSLLAAAWLWPKGRVMIDIRDLVWEYFLSGGGFKKPFGYVLRVAAKLSIHRAALVSVTNDGERRKVEATCGCPAVVMRNGLARERYQALCSLVSCKPPDGPINVTYVGNVGIAQGLDTLIFALGGRGDFRVTIVGAGADLSRIESLVNSRGFQNVIVTGQQPWDKVLTYYRDAHILYAQIGDAYKTAVPTKLFEYLVTGRHVVFGAPKGSASAIMESFQRVTWVAPGDEHGLRAAILSIAEAGDVIPTRANQERVRDQFLREPQADRYVHKLRHILGFEAGMPAVDELVGRKYHHS